MLADQPDRPRFVAMEVRLTCGEADSLATRLPSLQKMLSRRVLFWRDARDHHDLSAALAKIAAAIATAAEPFETEDWPPRPAPRRRKSRQKGTPT